MPDYIKQDDGTLQDSPELIADRVRRYIAGLNLGLDKQVATLHSTKLNKIITGKITALVTTTASASFPAPSPTFCFYSHLRTALIHQCLRTRGNYGPTVELHDPMVLMAKLMDDPEIPKLVNADVLVVMAQAFPYYAAAQQHIGNLLRLRHGLGKCSIFVKPNTYELLKRPEKALDADFVNFMSDDTLVGKLTLSEADLPKLIRKLHGVKIPGFTPTAKPRKGE